MIRSSTSQLARLCHYYLDCLRHDHLALSARHCEEEPGPPGEGSPYTQGLESELRALQLLDECQYRVTALGAWLNERTIEPAPVERQPLLEVLALNSEQRRAVCHALSNELTVITGPPGTGKSRVVTSILVNAARQGQTALFASKNNKAVDLVETRVNGLGFRPVLLRLGAKQYQSKLAEYLVSLPAATATPDDHERHRRSEAVQAQLRQRLDDLDAGLRTIVALRNEVDRLEQQVEPIRRELGEPAFRRVHAVNHCEVARAARRFQAAFERAFRVGQPFLTRVVWPFVRKARHGRVIEAGESFQRILDQIRWPIFEASPESSIAPTDRGGYRRGLSHRAAQAAAAAQYFGKLDMLAEARSLELLGGAWQELTEDLARNSRVLWQTWLRLQPSRTGLEVRQLLVEHGDVLQTIARADQHQPPDRDVFRRYYQLFPQIRSILSCWAVTALSVRGRVPFAPNFFDLLVIDEASQCDIASALPLLYRARRVAVIGDPMQLRHISALSSHEDHQLMSKHGLGPGRSAWAYSARSLFDLAASMSRDEDVVALVDHHRSHADIIQFSNDAFYGGRLRIATNHDLLRRPCPDEPAVRWLDVRGVAVRPAGGSALNEAEAQAVVKEIERLIIRGYRGSVGVVSPFRAQASRIRDLVRGHQSLVALLSHVDFLADTVHKFQGDERDVMIFSPVVSPGVTDTALGFLRANPNLFNVAISRARAALIVVGNLAAALTCGVDYLARFAAYSGQVEARDPPASDPGHVSEWADVLDGALRRAGLRPLRQHRVDRYLIDLALLNGERRLDIEVDGDRYHRSWDGELCRRHQIRNQRLAELGWEVLRFWVYQVRDDLDRSVERVLRWFQREEPV